MECFNLFCGFLFDFKHLVVLKNSIFLNSLISTIAYRKLQFHKVKCFFAEFLLIFCPIALWTADESRRCGSSGLGSFGLLAIGPLVAATFRLASGEKLDFFEVTGPRFFRKFRNKLIFLFFAVFRVTVV